MSIEGAAAVQRTVFIDFEASSLHKTSYPIEVAWVFDDGVGESFLIRPTPAWTDWAADAQRIHGIPRARLVADGKPVETVAAHMIDRLTGALLYATAPSWDGQWLSKLLRAGGAPRHALRVEDTPVAHRRIIRQVFGRLGVPAERQPTLLRAVLDEADRRFTTDEEPAHRALKDARVELRKWRLVESLAEAAACAGTPADVGVSKRP